MLEFETVGKFLEKIKIEFRGDNKEFITNKLLTGCDTWT